MKKAKNKFKVNHYKAGRILLDPKCYCSLKVDQETLDQCKSFNLFDTNYDTPLGNLEGLPPEPPLLKKFNKSSFSYDDFFVILATRRNASAPGLNGIPYKVYKKCPKKKPISFQNFSCLFQKVRNPYTMAKCSRNIYSKD